VYPAVLLIHFISAMLRKIKISIHKLRVIMKILIIIMLLLLQLFIICIIIMICFPITDFFLPWYFSS
jgi:hypothetical protein